MTSASTAYQRGRTAWPALEFDRSRFEQHLASLPPLSEPLSEERAADLYLASACAAGVPGAIAALEAAHFDALRRLLARIDPSAAFIEDGLQELREKLFVARDGKPPRIAGYEGRSSLRAWLRVSAGRALLNLKRNKDDQPHEPLRSGTGGADPGPELYYLKARYRPEFQRAVGVAIGRLPARDRVLLQLHLAERMSIDKLAALYKVGRSTAARWLSSAREALFADVRRELSTVLALTHSEFESLANLVRSDLDVSLATELARERG